MITITDHSSNDNEKEKPFCLKPIPSPGTAPILVFLNPKSGGNQGAKLMQKFQWLLNPRQVFDLTDGGPGPAIEMFRHVPNVKLLACGGDGTVGWLLSVLDKVTIGNVQLFVNLMFILYARWRFKIVNFAKKGP